jgi:3-deoxy-D-manno-octulosonic-acid transferase
MSERMGFVPSSPPGPGPIWIQAASVGEVLLARRLVRRLETIHPAGTVVLSTTTRTGQARAAALKIGTNRFFFPLDARSIVRRALDRLRPSLFVTIETEIWPHLIQELTRRGIPSAVASARLSPRSFRRYRRVRGAVAPALASLTLVAAGSREEAERYRALGTPDDRVFVAGNMKFDLEGAPLASGERAAMERDFGLDAGRPLLVAGSTGKGEESRVLEAFAAVADHPASPVLLLAPRHPERFPEVADQVAAAGWPWARRSAGTAPPGTRVVLLDTLGELADCYGMARGAFVGGSLVPVGGHNLLEPAVRAVPVCFGPHVDNVAEMAAVMFQAGAARQVDDPAALGRVWRAWLDRPEAAAAEGERGRLLVEEHRGATSRTVALLVRLIGWEPNDAENGR